jgi:starvation-inducible outer membrane lipoprotein
MINRKNIVTMVILALLLNSCSTREQQIAPTYQKEGKSIQQEGKERGGIIGGSLELGGNIVEMVGNFFNR